MDVSFSSPEFIILKSESSTKICPARWYIAFEIGNVEGGIRLALYKLRMSNTAMIRKPEEATLLA